MQRERRHDPYPWTWEPAALVMTAVTAGIVLGVQFGRTIANMLAGSGWTWPQSSTTDGPGPAVSSPVGGAFWRSLPGVLSGDAGAGLRRSAPQSLAGPRLLWATVAATELIVMAVLVVAGTWAYRRWGPRRLRGMATPAEAEATLGVTRIRKVASIVRPDLYGRRSRKRAAS